jgi:hypothetical protein
MKSVIVTAIVGNKDELIETQNTDGASELICFTDQPRESKIWTFKPASSEFSLPVMNAKRHKVLIHEYTDAPFSLWIDGCVQLNASISSLITKMGDLEIATFRHWLDCAYDEGDIIAEENRDDPQKIYAQLKKYESLGFPKNRGLHCGGFILRKHTERVREFNEIWWQEICNHSFRDQISLPYALWKTGLEMGNFGFWKAEEEITYSLKPHQFISNWKGELEPVLPGVENGQALEC